MGRALCHLPLLSAGSSTAHARMYVSGTYTRSVVNPAGRLDDPEYPRAGLAWRGFDLVPEFEVG